MRTILGLACCLACACSGSAGRPAPPTGPGTGAPSDTGAPVAAAPTAGECEQLVAHVVELVASERASLPAEQRPTEADRERVRPGLEVYVEECRVLPRASYECGLTATTVAALEACQDTPSSSTSNSSVAPPGITPPAPRSP